MPNFCTYFDINYLPHGLALYHSLKDHCGDFHLWVLCMDDNSYDILSKMALPELSLIKVSDFERGDDALSKAKQNRSRIEYYFTCTPSLPLYILKNFSHVNIITYVDADLYFYANPRQLFQEIGNHSVAIIEHRFAPRYKDMEICGKYNVGWLSFKRDEHAFNCLNWWRNCCNDWCYKVLEDGKYADQKYMDDWLTRFTNVKVIQHKGANLASWNIENYKVSMRDDKVWIDDQELIFFHFHGVKRLTKRIYGIGYHQTKVNNVIRENIYKPYLQKYLHICDALKVNAPSGSAIQNCRTFREKIRAYLSAIYRMFITGNCLKISYYD